MHSTIITKSAEETADVGFQMATSVKKHTYKTPRVYCLYGDLGSGKTTFTQGFARGLGFVGRLLSPTYLILRRYGVPNGWVLYHLDLYRANSLSDLKGIGLDEILSDENGCVIIEWAEKMGKLLPANRTDIHFSLHSDASHHIHIRHS